MFEAPAEAWRGMYGILIVSQPGGALLFQKKYEPNFGLSPPQTNGESSANKQQHSWEPWSLAGLLSSLQVFAATVATQSSHGGDIQVTRDAAASLAVEQTKMNSAPPSMSALSFGNCQLHFWLHKSLAEKQRGILTVVIFPRSSISSTSASMLTRSVAEAFAVHSRGLPLNKSVKGFSTVFKQTLRHHTVVLVEILVRAVTESLKRAVGDSVPNWNPSDASLKSHLSLVILKMTRSLQHSTAKDETKSTPNAGNVCEVVKLPQAKPKQPDPSKGVRPRRRFRIKSLSKLWPFHRNRDGSKGSDDGQGMRVLETPDAKRNGEEDRYYFRRKADSDSFVHISHDAISGDAELDSTQLKKMQSESTATYTPRNTGSRVNLSIVSSCDGARHWLAAESRSIRGYITVRVAIPIVCSLVPSDSLSTLALELESGLNSLWQHAAFLSHLKWCRKTKSSSTRVVEHVE